MAAEARPYATRPRTASCPPDAPHAAHDIAPGVVVDAAENGTAVVSDAAASGAAAGSAEQGQPAANSRTTPRCFRLSMAALIAASVAFSGVVAVAQVLVSHGYHPFQVVSARAVMLLSVTIGQLSWAGRIPVPQDEATGNFVGVGFAVLYGVLATADVTAGFYAAKWLPLTELSALWSLNPVFAPLGGLLWLKEPVTGVHAVGVLIFVGSAVCAMDPVATFSREDAASGATVWIARVLALFAAASTGFRVVVCRRLFAAGKLTCLAPQFWLGIIGVIVPSVASAYVGFKQSVASDEWPLYLWLPSMSIMSVAAQSLMGYAMPRESAVVLGVLWNLDVVFSLVWQPVLFGVPPTLYQYISVGLAVLAGGVVGAERQISAAITACYSNDAAHEAAA